MSDFTVYNDIQKVVMPQASTEQKTDSKFGEFLKDAVSEVNSLDQGSNDELYKFMNNETDLHSVMIALQKADLSFQVMMQVRNKIVSAYQEVMRSSV
jgi:flagellar hook-basal body complex protein FliE